MSWRVDVGDCVELMAAMPACSVDAVVCDPPYGLEFMGKEWDSLFRTYSRGSGRPDSPSIKPRREGWQPGSSYGGRAKQKRCMRCGKLMGRGDGVCKCPDPVPNLRHDEAGYQMQFWHERWATEALRVLKPGGHLLAFGGTRTSHRLACAIEDAGFEIRDTICWLYGLGFPKSLDVGKAIDKSAGAERKVVGRYKPPEGGAWNLRNDHAPTGYKDDFGARSASMDITAPATPDAAQWDGWGTALKPAHEPIVVARKPLAGTVAANVLEHGTGALNIDGGRVEATDAQLAEKYASVRNAGPRENAIYGTDGRERSEGRLEPHNGGRWPPNVALDQEAAEQLDRQSGERPSGAGNKNTAARPAVSAYGDGLGLGNGDGIGGDSGGASRFFYVAKASRAERNAGLDGFEEREAQPGSFSDYAELKWRNHHPTVKPVNLMRWLCRLVTPPDGLILDPFTGSGTTGIAAVLEGFNFLGCEQDAAYADIARARIGWWELHGHDALRIVAEQEAAEAERQEIRASGQLDLLGDPT